MLLLSNKFQVIRVPQESGTSSIDPTINGPNVDIAIDLLPQTIVAKDLKPNEYTSSSITGDNVLPSINRVLELKPEISIVKNLKPKV